MPEHPNGGLRYRVNASGVIIEELKQLQLRAAQEGRGDEVLAALRQITEQIQLEPLRFGEPLNRLPALRMQIRCAAVRPIYVSFGVCEDRPVVFLRSVKLLAAPPS